jgi:Flp pilus assembly protein TadG
MTKPTFVGDNSGQAIIEMALLSPLLILLFLGAVEYGRLYYIGIEVTNAAHAGVEYGSQNLIAAQDTADIQQASLNEESDLINKNVNGSGVLTPLATSTISTQPLCANFYYDTPFTCPLPTTTPYPPIRYVQVNTQVRVASLFNSYGFAKTYLLQGGAIMRVRE